MESLKVQGGFDAVRRILMPSVGMGGDTGRSRTLGVDGYLVKPIVSDEFHELLRRVLGLETKDSREHRPVTEHQIGEEQVRLALLVVDDVEINRMLAAAILEQMGHDVVCAKSGREAVELLTTRAFDAVFMDVQMPGLDGLQTTAVIRTQEMSSGGRRMPIIAMTAYALVTDRDRCLGAGMDGYVSKPVKPEKIREALEQCHVIPNESAKPLTQQLSGMPAVETGGVGLPLIPDAVPMIPVFDRAGLVNRLGGEELVDVFVNKFMAGMLVYVDKLQSELDCGSLDAVRSVAHAIKGLAANIGAEQVRQAAMDIETAARTGNLAGVTALQGRMLELYDAFARETVGDKSK